MAVHHFTASEFRSRQAQLFDLADKGEQIVIHRGKKRAYTLEPVNENDITITPELKARIERAVASVKAGNYTELSSPEDIDKYFESL